MLKIVAENAFHANQIYKWKKQALEDFALLLADDRKGERERTAEHERQINELYAGFHFAAQVDDASRWPGWILHKRIVYFYCSPCSYFSRRLA